MSVSTPTVRQSERRVSIPAGVQATGGPNADPPPNPPASTPGAPCESTTEGQPPPPTPTEDVGATYPYPPGAAPVMGGPPPVYPMIYSMVDANGYPVNMNPGSHQMVPAYYFTTPMFGYPSESSPGSSYFVGNGQGPDGNQPPVVYTPCYPPQSGNPGAGIGAPTTMSNAAVYYQQPSQCYPHGLGYLSTNSYLSNCACVHCRNAQTALAAQTPAAPSGPLTNGAPSGSPMTPAPTFSVIPADQDLLSLHRQSVASTTSPAVNSNGASPAVSTGANAGSMTPLSSRTAGEAGDMRRRLYQNSNGRGAENEDSTSASPANAISDRKKRKMGYLNNILYKTEICRDYQQGGTCPRGKSCQFAHGGNEVHHPKNHPLYKTAFCFDFKKDGKCPRGEACFHVHHSGEMRDKPNRSRGTRGPRFASRPGRGHSATPKSNTSPLVFTNRSRNAQQANDSVRARAGSVTSDGQPLSPASSGQESFSGETLPSTSDVKNTMLLLQRLSSENTATLLKKMAEDDALRPAVTH